MSSDGGPLEDPGAGVIAPLDELVSILLVDDESRNLDVLEAILGMSGHRLVRAQTADEALLALLSGDFAAIVLDIRMPGISGIELAQLIKQRKRSRDIPILFLTAHLSEESDVLRGYDVGAVDYLTKPVNPEILRSKISVFADLYRKTRALAAAKDALEIEVAERHKVEDALRQANEELEARVQERTADLTRINQTLRENEDRLRLAFEEKRQLLESERAARTEAERASRLKDDFLATVSHELRTPLNAILGWAHILTQGQESRPEVSGQGLDAILRNARAQAHLIEDLLDMSRIVSGKIRLNLQAVDLCEIIASAVGTITPAAKAKEIRLECIPIDRSPAVQGDPDRLQQILLNLLSNAVKFTPPGGRVSVSIEIGDAWAEIVVRDTGQGITPQFMPHVFDPFRQADSSTTRRHGGLGLGLAVANHLVELHGGRILVESPGEGLGSTFTIRLPRAGGPLREQVAKQESEPAGAFVREPEADTGTNHLEGARILVVEDEPDTRSALARFLEDQGATVVAVGSAGEALELLRCDVWDVLVSDIGMPGMDGYELIRELRSHEASSGRCLPAVAVTAFTRWEDQERVLREGFSRYVPKPVNTVRLIGLLAELARQGAGGEGAPMRPLSDEGREPSPRSPGQ
ncbi:MAG TPA: response regulator [Thermoanaerobaculia bacterium]|nr:response regulator [Thermoanaerobaculia bacterium]